MGVIVGLVMFYVSYDALGGTDNSEDYTISGVEKIVDGCL